jgi:uncharacterized protein YdcH (DUF465 family)
VHLEEDGMDEAELKERLSQEDPEFKRVSALHRAHEKRLQELNRKSHLSEEEEHELKELKKKKLVLKDKLYLRLAQYRNTVT